MKILISSVSTGAGHLRAAEALAGAFQTAYPHVKVLHVNAMHYVTKPFRKVYEDGYSFVVNRAPSLWSSLYSLTDGRRSERIGRHFFNSFQSWNASAFFDCIDRFEPDRILTTHFFIPQILSKKHRAGLFTIPVECVITDFDFHRYWFDECVSHYYVAREKVEIKLRRFGVAPDRITVSGIPIDPRFIEPVNRGAVLSRYGLREEIPSLLILSGGLGFGAMDKTVNHLFALKHRLQIISVSGKNELKRLRMESLKPPPNISLVNLGYVDNMHELVGASDIVVTKAGGLTVAECLAKGAATLIFGPIPGQEEKNALYLERKGAGVRVDSLDDLSRKLNELLKFPEALARLRRNASACGKPRAAFDIVDQVMRRSNLSIKPTFQSILGDSCIGPDRL